ncbi:MAG: prepilin-type N-terminal cleavage/methylation domain-containing protein [Desulfovibrio sp.]
MRGGSRDQTSERGVTLIELIISLLIFSIMAIAGTMFISLAVNSYLITDEAVRSAQGAHNALNRLGIELKSAEGLGGANTVVLAANTSLQYASSDANLSGTRTVRLSGGNLYLAVNGTNHLLLENVTDFTLQVEQNDTDGDSSNLEISSINISFRIGGTGATYELNVTPRAFIRL